MTKNHPLNLAIKNRLDKKEKCSRSEILKIVLEELTKAGKFRSCVITDVNGLTLSEHIHKQAKLDDLVAACSLSSDFVSRFKDYLQLGNTNFGYFESSASRIWLKEINLANSDEKFMLMVTMDNKFYDKLPSKTLKLLNKNIVHIPTLLDIASECIVSCL